MLGPAHEVTANFDGPSVLDFVAQTGMLRDDKQNALDIQADVARCGGAIGRPPLSQPFNFSLSASLDDVFERHVQP